MTIESTELDDSCGAYWAWIPFNGGGASSGVGSVVGYGPAMATLDDDGNAVFLLTAQSCAAGTWDVSADVDAGTRPTYTTMFTVSPPAVTI